MYIPLSRVWTGDSYEDTRPAWGLQVVGLFIESPVNTPVAFR